MAATEKTYRKSVKKKRTQRFFFRRKKMCIIRMGGKTAEQQTFSDKIIYFIGFLHFMACVCSMLVYTREKKLSGTQNTARISFFNCQVWDFVFPVTNFFFASHFSLSHPKSFSFYLFAFRVRVRVCVHQLHHLTIVKTANKPYYSVCLSSNWNTMNTK